MINTDVLSRGALLAGPHPQRHGDWLGATLEFDVREGSRDRASVRAAVSGTSASAVVEGPIGRAQRGSWLFSVAQELHRLADPEDRSGHRQHDRLQRRQAKVVYDLTPRQQLQFFAIGGDATYREAADGAAERSASTRSRRRA